MGVDVGSGVGVEMKDGTVGAFGFGAFKAGSKVTVPKWIVSFLLSQIVWLIVGMSVDPHQLFAAYRLFESVKWMFWVYPPV